MEGQPLSDCCRENSNQQDNVNHNDGFLPLFVTSFEEYGSMSIHSPKPTTMDAKKKHKSNLAKEEVCWSEEWGGPDRMLMRVIEVLQNLPGTGTVLSNEMRTCVSETPLPQPADRRVGLGEGLGDENFWRAGSGYSEVRPKNEAFFRTITGKICQGPPYN